jgi:hypothetical protein
VHAEAELEPVFAALADVQAECERLRRAGAAAASRREADAGRRAQALVAGAQAAAEAERAGAGAAVRCQAAAAAAEILANARTEAETLHRRDEAARAGAVSRILDRVRIELGDLAARDGTDDGLGPR